jgi:hypothetical protein
MRERGPSQQAQPRCRHGLRSRSDRRRARQKQELVAQDRRAGERARPAVLPQQPLGALTGGAWRIGYEREPKCPDSPSTNKVGGGYERMPVGLYKALRIETRAPLVLRGSVVGDAELHAEDILDAYLLGGRHITRQWRDTTYRLASDRTQASRARWRSPQMKGAFIRPASVEIAHHVVGQCKMRSWRAGGGRAELDETAVGVVSATVTLVMQCSRQVPARRLGAWHHPETALRKSCCSRHCSVQSVSRGDFRLLCRRQLDVRVSPRTELK